MASIFDWFVYFSGVKPKDRLHLMGINTPPSVRDILWSLTKVNLGWFGWSLCLSVSTTEWMIKN